MYKTMAEAENLYEAPTSSASKVYTPLSGKLVINLFLILYHSYDQIYGIPTLTKFSKLNVWAKT